MWEYGIAVFKNLIYFLKIAAMVFWSTMSNYNLTTFLNGVKAEYM